MSDKTVYDWTVGDLHEWLAEIKGDLNIEAPCALNGRKWRVRVVGMGVSVAVLDQSMVIALDVAHRKIMAALS